MTTLRPRENTFKVDLSVFPKRPSFEEIHSFVHDTMGLRIDQVKRLQMNHVQNAAHVKCDTLKTAQDAVDQHNERHEIEGEQVWGDSFAYKGVSSGIRVAKMTLKKDIKSFVTIQQEQTLITYRGQPRTCRHCGRISHPGMTCTDNKKLEGQKNALDERLKVCTVYSRPATLIVVDKGTEKTKRCTYTKCATDAALSDFEQSD
ncbi:hypothetical protein quinque_007845 [Culex quinquefasciatus]